MKTLIFSLLIVVTIGATSIYDFKVAGLEGNEIDMAQFKGKKDHDR